MPHSTAPQHEELSHLAAKILIEIEAVHFRSDDPFTLTSGWKSPVYIDCRHIISFPRARKALMKLATDLIYKKIGFETLDIIAGGETAGIPFAAWIASNMELPMVYIRKKPKGFGRNAQIEGDEVVDKKAILVEDLTTDGASKVAFVNGLRKAGAQVKHAFSIFYYDIFPTSRQHLAQQDIELLYLCTWWDILHVAKTHPTLQKQTASVESFLHDPCGWSAKHGGVSDLDEAQAYKEKSTR